MPRKPSAATIANEKVSIVAACRLIGMDLPEDLGFYGKSLKVHCPFGAIYHSDGGVEAAFRIYPDSNSAYCFACKARFSPAWLAAQAWDQDITTAAESLLEQTGYRPLSYQETWVNLIEDEPAPDVNYLGEAFKVFCSRLTPEWRRLQFEPDVAVSLSRCLSLLDLVRTAEQAKQWLAGCKKVMEATLSRVSALD